MSEFIEKPKDKELELPTSSPFMRRNSFATLGSDLEADPA